MASLMNGT